MNSPATTPSGLLLSGDLFFTSKVTGTADSLGFRVDVVGSPTQVAERIESADYRCVFLDLGTPGLSVAALVESLPESRRPRVVAFGPHVHTKLLEEARAAGCDEVLPRSRFSSTLPEILQRYLGE